MPISLLLVTSLRRRAQANAPAASYRLRHVLGAEIRRVRRAVGGGGGAYKARLSRFDVCFVEALRISSARSAVRSCR